MFRFDLRKTFQAAAVLLRAHPLHAMSRLRLLKLLYIADRESLKETGAPVTADRAVAMKQGPVLGQTYDLIKGEHLRAGEWAEYFESIGYQVKLVKDPGTGRLSRYEIEKLNEVAARYEHDEDEAIADVTHAFKEWQRNARGDSSKPIPFEHILEAVGRRRDIAAIHREAKAAEFMDRVLGEA